MDHWKVEKPPPSHKSNFLSLNCETRESDSSCGQATRSPSHVPKMDRQFCKVPAKSTMNVKAVATNVANIVDGTAVFMVSQNSKDEEPDFGPSLVLGLTLQDNATSTPKNERASGCSYDKVWNPLAMQSSSKNLIDGSKRLFPSDNFMGKKSIMVSTPFHGSPLRPSSRQVTHSLDTDENSLNHASVNTPSLQNRALSLLQNNRPSTGQKRMLTFLAENYHEGFLGHPETTEQETSCSENSAVLSHHVVDLNITTTCAFMDSNERLTTGQPTFSQTTHQFFSEKTGTHLSKRGQFFLKSSMKEIIHLVNFSACL